MFLKRHYNYQFKYWKTATGSFDVIYSIYHSVLRALLPETSSVILETCHFLITSRPFLVSNLFLIPSFLHFVRFQVWLKILRFSLISFSKIPPRQTQTEHFHSTMPPTLNSCYLWILSNIPRLIQIQFSHSAIPSPFNFSLLIFRFYQTLLDPSSTFQTLIQIYLADFLSMIPFCPRLTRQA